MSLQLYYAGGSPFVRKVMVMAAETGQTIETLPVSVSPLSRDDGVTAQNPLGKIPSAISEDGPLYDSRVICQWLDAHHDGAKLYPAEGKARWTALRREALADGIADAAVLSRYETAMRPADKQWDGWLDGQRAKINGALDALEAEAADFGDSVDAGTIAIGCALGYLDFRFGDLGWRDSRPTLAAWFEAFSKRPAMAETAPPKG